uniref:Uncharacterized protein n=1 Tax=Arundo donax TaxID=35708 RepID=A0A0A8ZA73_ARUDO
MEANEKLLKRDYLLIDCKLYSVKVTF